jgi:transcriptional regulator with XRE-family HTH domain
MSAYLMGQQLRSIREDLRLTLKDVEKRSREIAELRQNPEYIFTAGRLSQVENSNSLPSLYKLATLSEIYAVPYADLLHFYGIALETTGVPGKNGNGHGEAFASLAPVNHKYA